MPIVKELSKHHLINVFKTTSAIVAKVGATNVHPLVKQNLESKHGTHPPKICVEINNAPEVKSSVLFRFECKCNRERIT